MPRKASKKTVIKKSAKSAPRRAVSKEPSFQGRINSFLNSIRPNRLETTSTPRVPRKYLLPLVGLVVLLFVGYLASRFLVVAWVDQKPITRFSYYDQLDKKFGKDLKEQLIVEALIESESAKRGLSATSQEVDEEIKKIEQEQGGASNLDQVLQMQGISRDELRRLVRLQILRQKMFADSTNVTETEVDNYIEQNKANLPETEPKDASATANLRNNVRKQLRQQKLNATFSSWLQDNLQSKRVIRL